jgi:hypothetical protein
MSPSVRRSNGNTAGHFDFLHREYSPFQRAYMALLNALVAAVGFTLKLGGRPLKNLLILGFGRSRQTTTGSEGVPTLCSLHARLPV